MVREFGGYRWVVGIDDIQSDDYVQVVISKNGTTTATGTDTIKYKQRSI